MVVLLGFGLDLHVWISPDAGAAASNLRCLALGSVAGLILCCSLQWMQNMAVLGFSVLSAKPCVKRILVRRLTLCVCVCENRIGYTCAFTHKLAHIRVQRGEETKWSAVTVALE